MKKFAALSGILVIVGSAQAFAAGSQFQVGNHELISGSVLETSTDGATAQPAGTSGNPIYVSGGGGGSAGANGAAGVAGSTAQYVQGIAGGVPVPVSGSLTTTPGPIYGQNGTSADSTSNPLAANVAQIGGVTVSLGQTTMSASLPVTIANNQSALTTADQNILSSYAAQGATAPTGGISLEGEYLSTLPTLTTGQVSREMLDANGRQELGTSTASIGTVILGTGAAAVGSVVDTTAATTIAAAAGATLPTNAQAQSAEYLATLTSRTTGQAAVDLTDVQGRLLVNTSTNNTPTGIAASLPALGATPTLIAAAGAIKEQFTIQNVTNVALFFSTTAAAATTLTYSNAMLLPAGASFSSPVGYPLGGALQVQSTTATACTASSTVGCALGEYK